MMQQTFQFIRDAYAELRLVHWLTRKQVIASSILVMILTAVVALYVGAVDFVLLIVARIFVGVR